MFEAFSVLHICSMFNSLCHQSSCAMTLILRKVEKSDNSVVFTFAWCQQSPFTKMTCIFQIITGRSCQLFKMKELGAPIGKFSSYDPLLSVITSHHTIAVNTHNITSYIVCEPWNKTLADITSVINQIFVSWCPLIKCFTERWEAKTVECHYSFIIADLSCQQAVNLPLIAINCFDPPDRDLNNIMNLNECSIYVWDASA